MATFSNLDYRRGGTTPKVNLVVTAIAQLGSAFSRGQCSCESPIEQKRMRLRNRATSFLVLCQILLLSVGLAATPTGTFAGEENSAFQRANDPTGVWLNSKPVILLTFHADGTYSADIVGEGAFVPGNDNPGFQITSPTHVLWQKTGARTFMATAFALQYNDDGSFYALLKTGITGLLNGSANQMDITISGGIFDLNGNLISSIPRGTGHFVRLHLDKPQ
jgi:hypothetical protein